MNGTYFQWRELTDDYVPNVFAIAPRTGQLLVFDSAESLENPTLFLKLIGLLPGRRMADLGVSRGNPLNVPEKFKVSQKSEIDVPRLRKTINMVLKWLPLSVAVKLIGNKKSTDNKLLSPKSFDQALALTSSTLGSRSKGDCLELSLARFWLLRCMGYKPTINIGVLVPTEEMHAWVEIDKHPILECEDKLAHYQTAVRYFAD